MLVQLAAQFFVLVALNRMVLGLFRQDKSFDIFQLPPGGTGCTGID